VILLFAILFVANFGAQKKRKRKKKKEKRKKKLEIKNTKNNNTYRGTMALLAKTLGCTTAYVPL
jgi:hypothetical protein